MPSRPTCQHPPEVSAGRRRRLRSPGDEPVLTRFWGSAVRCRSILAGTNIEMLASGSFTGFIAKRKQASRTPNASRIMTSRSMSERQGLRSNRTSRQRLECAKLACALVCRPSALFFEGLHSGHSKNELLLRGLKSGRNRLQVRRRRVARFW